MLIEYRLALAVANLEDIQNDLVRPGIGLSAENIHPHAAEGGCRLREKSLAVPRAEHHLRIAELGKVLPIQHWRCARKRRLRDFLEELVNDSQAPNQLRHIDSLPITRGHALEMGIDFVEANSLGRSGFDLGTHFLRGIGRGRRPSDVGFHWTAFYHVAPNASLMPEGF